MQERDAISGHDNWDKQLRKITPTENPRSSKVTGVEHKASNILLLNRHAKKFQHTKYIFSSSLPAYL
jgi:hypothetical protein